MGNKQGKAKEIQFAFDQGYLDELAGGSASSPGGLSKKTRSRSTQSNSSSSITRKTSFIAPPQSPAKRIAERWDCESCGCSNESNVIVCFGCKEVRI
jgi:hypothetical protein